MTSDSEKTHRMAFKQQKLKPIIYRPLINSNILVRILFIIGVLFSFIGLILYSGDFSIREQTFRYDNYSACQVTIKMKKTTLPKKCEIILKLEEEMELPVFFYYELSEVFQNHRTYMTNYNKTQLILKKKNRNRK